LQTKIGDLERGNYHATIGPKKTRWTLCQQPGKGGRFFCRAPGGKASPKRVFAEKGPLPGTWNGGVKKQGDNRSIKGFLRRGWVKRIAGMDSIPVSVPTPGCS